MTEQELIAKLRLRVRNLQERVRLLREKRDTWRELAQRLQAEGEHHVWPPKVERWRSVAEYFFEAEDVDLALGIILYESEGNPLAVCRVDWVGPEPPGYDGTAATRASGLFQMVPAYWPDRARAAGFEGRNIFDVEAQFGVAAWLAYYNWGHEGAPFWRQHWGGSHVNVMGSYEKACRDLGIDP